jgi:hypothetical protein
MRRSVTCCMLYALNNINYQVIVYGKFFLVQLAMQRVHVHGTCYYGLLCGLPTGLAVV